MKEVEKVSLGGYAFTLDEDAARLAADYLGELERHYAGREGGSEILEGIEERMAELVREKCGRDGVASRAIIEEIIGILGRPEDIESEEDEDSRPGAAPSGTEPQTRRKLYRDVSDKVIAGVCSGLGVYFNLDKVLFRLIFAILTLLPLLGLNSRHGFSWQVELLSPALYLVLWICMPPARTARQRWEQRGEDGTIHGIQQRVENGAREAGEALHSVGKSNAWSEIGRIFEKLVGVVLLILGFGGLFAGSVALFGTGAVGRKGAATAGFLGLGQLYNQGLSKLSQQAPVVADALTHPLVQAVMLLVLFLPFLGILYGALQLLFGFKSPKWHPGLVIFVLWLMSIIAAGILILTGTMTSELITV